MKKAIVAMQTDFSLRSAAVSVMHGVCYQVDEELVVEDISHEVSKFNPFAASVSLAYTIPYWPKGTVFVSVIDPGVGTERKACVAKLKNGSFIVTPDNGALTHVHQQIGIEEIRIISEKNRYQGTERIEIFHGRDLFAYCAAKLAANKITFEEVGEKYPLGEMVLIDIPKPVMEENRVCGFVEGANLNFGITTSNIPLAYMDEMGFVFGDVVRLIVRKDDKIYYDKETIYHQSFGHVPIGVELCYPCEGNKVGFACNQDDFIEKYQISLGIEWEVIIERID